jgi:hypothetical protein
MATDGAFTPDGVFHPLPTMSLAPMEELFRHRVCKMLMKKGLLSAERVKLMESWEHSGFNIDASVRIGADDATGRENLARYLIRAPFSAERITYNAAEGTVIYRTKNSTGANGNEVLPEPLPPTCPENHTHHEPKHHLNGCSRAGCLSGRGWKVP